MRLVMIPLLALLASCTASSGMSAAMLQAYGNARIVPDPADPHMLTLSLQSMWDIGYDLDRDADRRALVTTMLSDQCGNPQITEQLFTQTRPRFAGRVPGIYTIRVACPNGASRKVE
jgi:hypothetical protein